MKGFIMSEIRKAMDYDAVIIGGGHNGLTCGAYLSKAGLRTLVLERREIIGGGAVTEEFSPGFKVSRFAYITGSLNAQVIADLELNRFGLEIIKIGRSITPLHGGDYIVSSGDVKETSAQIARFSKKDAENYPKFLNHVSKSVDILRRLRLETPLDISRTDTSGLIELVKFAWRYRDARRSVYDLFDAFTMSAYHYVDRWFESDVAKNIFCSKAAINSNLGPHSPTTAIYILALMTGTQGLSTPRGGMGAVCDALSAAGKLHGMKVITEASVEEILTRNGRAVGVRLANGDEYYAKLVVSNADAGTTFLKLIKGDTLPGYFLKQVKDFRVKSTSFKVNLAVDRPPQYTGFNPAAAGYETPAFASIAPTTDYLEKAYDCAKYGWYSEHPMLSPYVITQMDPGLAPVGKHVVTIWGIHAPYELRNANWEDEKDNFSRTILSTMDEFAPGFSSGIVDMEVLTPRDIERITGMPGGHTSHGQATVDQLLFKRPVPRYADYRSPITGLYQCGASTHPGGSVTGLPGRNSAREILRDWKRLK